MFVGEMPPAGEDGGTSCEMVCVVVVVVVVGCSVVRCRAMWCDKVLCGIIRLATPACIELRVTPFGEKTTLHVARDPTRLQPLP